MGEKGIFPEKNKALHKERGRKLIQEKKISSTTF